MSLKKYDDELRKKFNVDYIIGADEAGRGAWAGPIVGAAVCFDKSFDNDSIRDSKTINEHDARIKIAELIKENALYWHVEMCTACFIDENGITQANKIVLESSCSSIASKIQEPCLFVIDQSPASGLKPLVMTPKADSKSLTVAAASILAKTSRDLMMIDFHEVYPNFNFQNHKGYVNNEHIEEVKKYGRIEYVHRMSYKVAAIQDTLLQQLSIFDV